MKLTLKKIFIGLIICTSLVLQAQDYEEFKNKNELFLVDIGEAQLGTRYQKGEGIPIIFVHGSWGDHNHWVPIVSEISQEIKNPIIIYDRRGHSVSSPDTKQGSIGEDVNDIVLLMKNLSIKKANFVGHSYGSNIVIQLSIQHPELVNDIYLYEPPLFALLKGKQEYKKSFLEVRNSMLSAKSLLEKGEVEKGTIKFMENVAFGKGSWLKMFDNASRMSMLSNYRTWLDQSRDPQRLAVNTTKLNNFTGNITIIHGTLSLPSFGDVIKELDKILDKKDIIAIKDAGHGGIFTHHKQISEIIIKKQ